MPITATESHAVCEFVRDVCGIQLDRSKDYLIESRLNTLLRDSGHASYADFIDEARTPSGRPLSRRIVDAITTNETYFFRDHSPFDALKYRVLPDLIDARASSSHPRRIRIWSAACSTGQEPYSIAMALLELIPDPSDWDISILATDISEAALHKAAQGWYNQLDSERGMAPDIREAHFETRDGGWQISDVVRSMVTFKPLNLLAPFSTVPRMDIVFCRNVAIYFAKQQRDDLFHRLKRVLTSDGYLFVGSSESLHDMSNDFSLHAHCRSSFYRPTNNESPNSGSATSS